MTCDELKDDYGSYALGSLEGEELAELRTHLERNCANCTAGVRDANSVVAALASSVKLVDPPKRLRKRVLAMVAPDASGSRMAWLFALTTALALFVASYIWLQNEQAHQQAVMADGRFNKLFADFARLNETVALLQDPAAKEVTFGKGASGRVVISPKHGVAFSGQNMAALAPGKTYEMWIIPKGGNPIPAGTFAPAADGSALHVAGGPVEIAAVAAVAISIEQEGGVNSPTKDQIIIVAPVGQ